ncbi:hypothetical protein NGB36_21775 [Streptomyces sp. RB6PN25]|uniref:Uncharacterized protein n=1 Tax=Streptomyces humicola TaxID=2953240 RepID=A0ABT1PZS0_9ACTN|nr:hypothetical protein [Streptomyces humicola]MCQ4083163.1 hypothetical protein [Streptomyces humicola]
MNHLTPLIHHGYWCECWTQSPTTGDAAVLLASFDTTSAAHAVRWIRVALRTLASVDPDAFAGAWGWLTGGYVADIEALAGTEPCTISIRHKDTHVQWTARPVLFLGLAHRQADNLPACAGKFTPLTAAPVPH